MTDADQTPPLLSDEEKTVTVYLGIAAVVGILAAIWSLALVIRALPDAGEPLDTARLGTALAIMTVTWSAILFAIFGRWPGTVSSNASIDVKAAPYEVWDAFALRDDYPGWKKIYTGIERLDESGEVYRVHYADDSDCPRCALPRNPDRSRLSSRIEILESRRPFVYRQRSFPKTAPGIHWAKDRFLESEDMTMALHPLPGGGTRVTFSSTVVRPKVWMAFLTMLGRPAREHLRSLKAHVEGTPDDTLFSISAKRMEAARNAAQQCGCGEAA